MGKESRVATLAVASGGFQVGPDKGPREEDR